MQKLLSLWQIAIAVSLKKNCKHGTYMPDTKTCSCDDHWHTAGVTDTIDFLEGVCEQYQCASDKMCQDRLRGQIDDSDLSDVSCPVRGWNCYCGWKYAFMFGGHGFETERLENMTNADESGAECMGVMYTFSMWSYFTLLWLVQKVFTITLICFIGFLFVGKKRVRCDHHDPTLLKEVRKLCGRPPVCNGGCHSQTLSEWTLDRTMDEFAWSFYALSVGTWTLTFLGVSFGLMIFAWSIVLWALVMLILIAAAVAALCMLCGEAAGGQSCDCSCDCADCGCCDPEPGLLDDVGVTEMMYFGGPHPVDGMFWFDCSGAGSSTGQDGCCCCNCSGLCCPIAWLVLRFPRMPENMWGGFLGWCMGTHPFAPAESAYRGGSDFIDFLAMQWMRAGDLHGHNEWRRQVQTFLYDMDSTELMYNDDAGTLSDGEQRSYRIGNTAIEKIPRKFGEGDRCVQSSFEDYMNNNCWICQSKDETAAWDLWLTCRHMYCQHCSEKMLKRRMPCPLCRVASTTIWRGLAFNSIPSHSH